MFFCWPSSARAQAWWVPRFLFLAEITSPEMLLVCRNLLAVKRKLEISRYGASTSSYTTEH